MLFTNNPKSKWLPPTYNDQFPVIAMAFPSFQEEGQSNPTTAFFQTCFNNTNPQAGCKIVVNVIDADAPIDSTGIETILDTELVFTDETHFFWPWKGESDLSKLVNSKITLDLSQYEG